MRVQVNGRSEELGPLNGRDSAGELGKKLKMILFVGKKFRKEYTSSSPGAVEPNADGHPRARGNFKVRSRFGERGGTTRIAPLGGTAVKSSGITEGKETERVNNAKPHPYARSQGRDNLEKPITGNT